MIQRMSKAEQNHQTQSAPKHCKKSSDLRRHLKAVSECICVCSIWIMNQINEIKQNVAKDAF